MIKCIIIEDEKLARDKLKVFIAKNVYSSFIGEYSSVESFLEDGTVDVDLMFLDIQLPGSSGLELANKLSKEINFIFTTAHSEFAAYAFDLHAVDYLLKPFSENRFNQAIDKFIKYKAGKTTTFITLKSGKTSHQIELKNIYYIEGMKEYVCWHTNEGKIVTLDSLSNLEVTYKDLGLVRCHKSYLINIHQQLLLNGNSIHLKDKIIPMGRTYKTELKKLLRTK